MDRNICNDGTTTYNSSNYYCRYQWYPAYDNSYGPTRVMQELYAGTKDWNNVPNMIMNYIDENNSEVENKGYISIITNNGVTAITGKPTTKITTVGTSSKPLKARLPKISEISAAGCTGNAGSCPIWLMENLEYYLVTNDKYAMNNNGEAYQNIEGYWTLSSLNDNSDRSYFVRYMGYLLAYPARHFYGARPVITVPLSDLSN